MKVTGLCLASMGLNALLLMAFLHQRNSTSERISGASVPNDAAHIAQNSPGIDPVPENGGNPTAPTSFHWSQLHMEPWAAYRDELRKIGCPDPTIRDILQPLVHASFIERRRNLTAPWIPRFWELMVPPKSTWVPLNQSLEALDEEERQTLDQLIGGLSDANNGSSVNDSAAIDQHQILGMLSEEHRVQVEEILAREQEALIALGSQENLSPTERPKRFKELDELTRQKIDEVLDPAEAEQFHLRSSPYSSIREIDSIDLTEEEIRRIIQLRERNSRAEQPEDEAAALVQLLGPEKAEAFQAAENPEFQQVYESTSGLENGFQKAKELLILEYQIRGLTQNVDSGAMPDTPDTPDSAKPSTVPPASAVESLQTWINDRARQILGTEDRVEFWRYLQKNNPPGDAQPDAMAPWEDPPEPGP